MTPEFHHHRLSNGLTLIAERQSQAHTAAVGFFVKAGARDEDKSLMGVSHFLEHMMFKGTDRRSADDVNREFDEIGANYNAYTSHENTVYYAQVLPDFLFRAVDLFTDILRPALREDDFNVEKKVILEEISMYEDRPQWRLHDTLVEKHYGEHPLSHRVLGTGTSITTLRAEQMRGYFRHWYSPDNIVVAAAGRLDFRKLVDELAQRTQSWQPSGAARRYEQPTLRTQLATVTDEKLARHYVAATWPGPSAQDSRRYAAAILADVLGDQDGSRLHWALIDPGLCDEADLSYQPQDALGSFVAYASCDPRRAEEIERILLKTIDHYADSIEPLEIERAKNKLATQATLSGETPGGRMRGLGTQWLYQGVYTPLAEEIQRLMAVTPDDVRRLLVEMPFEPRTLVRLGPC